jgi:GNAT superfamily N-acetyltransferase
MPRDIQILTDSSRFQELAKVKHAAYHSNSFYAASYPSHHAALMKTWLEEREIYELRSDATQQFVAIVDTDLLGLNGEKGKILAWVRVKQPTRLVKAEAPSETDTAVNSAAAPLVAATSPVGESGNMDPMSKYGPPPLPPGSNLQLQLCLHENTKSQKELHYNTTVDYKIGSVATHPDFQGQGLGSRILAWINEQAGSF